MANPDVEALKVEFARNADITKGLSEVVSQLVGTVKKMADTQAQTTADLSQLDSIVTSAKAANDAAAKLLADARASLPAK